MTEQSTGDRAGEFERDVKEFGNGGHVVLPGEFVGETVRITPIKDGESNIRPPITKEKITRTLKAATRDDFTLRTREEDNFPREGEYQYDSDVRLSIDVDLVREGDGYQITEEETGRVVHQLRDATSEELLEHTDWWTREDARRAMETEDEINARAQPEPLLLCLDPIAEELFDDPGVGYGDVYRYSVQWNDSEIVSVMFCNRSAKHGRFYVPFWQEYESLEQYRSSSAYALATAISAAPADEYDQYLEAMTDRGIGWNGDPDRDAVRELTHEEKLEQTVVCPP